MRRRGCSIRRGPPPRRSSAGPAWRSSCWSAPGWRGVSSRRRGWRSSPCARSSGWSGPSRCAPPPSWPRGCSRPRPASMSGRERCSRMRSIASSEAVRRSRPRGRESSSPPASPPWAEPSWPSARCWDSSPRGSPTGRSPSGSSSQSTPSIATSPTSCESSTSPRAPPRPPLRCARVCSTTPGDSQTWRYRVRPKDGRFGRSQGRPPALRSPQMKRRVDPGRAMIEAAALARIDELAKTGAGEDRRSDMTNHEETGAPVAADTRRELKAATRAAWALGDYHRFAKETIWELGEVLVRACGIAAGQRVLDVAAGTGNTAIRAAETGAEVVASDLTPENFEAGRLEARAHGGELDWVGADAGNLPSEDSEFDVVTSSFGAIFAPDHRAVADEMLRVCRQGATIGMLNFTPEGLISGFFGALAPYMPPSPPEALPPPLW